MHSSLLTIVAGVTLLASLPFSAHFGSSAHAGKPVQARRAHPARSSEAKPPAEVAPSAEAAPAEPALPKGAMVGPNKVKLADQAELDLPAGYLYLPKDELDRLLAKQGDPADPNAIGGVFSLSDDESSRHWFLIEWNAAGYVKDNDADDLKPDEILESYKEGTEEANEYRKEHGAAAVHVTGWDEKPRYDKVKKHVVWALRVHGDDGEDSTNYNTRLLGRNGYLSMNLICKPTLIAALKPAATDMLNRVAYAEGKRYADYNKVSDKTAEFGVAALVIGGAALAGKAAKIGLLAKFGKVLLLIFVKGFKAVALFFIGILAFFKRIFGGKSAKMPVADPPSQTPSPAASAVEPAAPVATESANGDGSQSKEGTSGPGGT